MQTHNETVYRFRIMRHDDLPESHKKAYRERGINPDDVWSLIYSFKNEDDAREELERCNEDAANWETYKIVDNGKDEIIERPVY